MERYGHYSLAAESMYDRPFQWGSKRTGPDLARIGGKYPNLWHYHHMDDPRSTSRRLKGDPNHASFRHPRPARHQRPSRPLPQSTRERSDGHARHLLEQVAGREEEAWVREQSPATGVATAAAESPGPGMRCRDAGVPVTLR